MPYFDGVSDTEKKQRQIVIPSPDGDPAKAQLVDYEVALELIARVEKFEILDNVTRKAFLKGNAEVYVRNAEVYHEPKFRDMVREYVTRVADPETAFYSYEVLDKMPEGGWKANQTQRFEIGDLMELKESDLTPEQRRYTYTQEGIAKRLQALKEARAALPTDQQKPYKDEIAIVEARLKKFVELDEIESILYESQYGLFVNKPVNERLERRRDLRKGLDNIMNATAGGDQTIFAQAQETVIRRELQKLIAANPTADPDALRNDFIQKNQENIRQATLKFIFADRFNMPRGERDPGHMSLGAQIINKFFNEDELLVEGIRTSIGDGISDAEDIQLANLSEVVKQQMDPAFKELYNYGNFDKRPLERLMSHKSEADLEKIRRDLMSNMQDKDKYRQEMKDKTIEIMQLADFHAHEFNKYRRAKYFWDAMARNMRRYNTIFFMGAAAAMFLVASPIAFPALLTSIGISKTLLPFLDMRHAIAVNRRNYARELARKIRAESNRVIEMFERGQTLNQNMRDDLEDLVLEYNIMGESIQTKFKPEGWKPNANFLIDTMTKSLMDEQSGLIPQALAAGR
jgi:hypothetical protein